MFACLFVHSLFFGFFGFHIRRLKRLYGFFTTYPKYFFSLGQEISLGTALGIFDTLQKVWIPQNELGSWHGVQKESDSLDQYVDFLEGKNGALIITAWSSRCLLQVKPWFFGYVLKTWNFQGLVQKHACQECLQQLLVLLCSCISVYLVLKKIAE